ncbi:MAG: hypothetical protein R3B90_09930 [Planctomycetaceae bacterium]
MFRLPVFLLCLSLLLILPGCEDSQPVVPTSGGGEPADRVATAEPSGAEGEATEAASGGETAAAAGEQPAGGGTTAEPVGPQDDPAAVAKLKELGVVLKEKDGVVTQADCASAPITDENVTLFQGTPSLKLLSLQNATITDDGLAIVDHLPGLVSISLQRCSQVTNPGLEHLTRAESLREVKLLYTTISDDGLEHLGKMEGLVSLDLRGATFATRGSSTSRG